MSGFDYSMTFTFTSTDIRNVDIAVERGFDWLLTGWLGHSESEKLDLPVYGADDKKLTALRKPKYPHIKKQIERLAEFHAEAKKRGLKVAVAPVGSHAKTNKATHPDREFYARYCPVRTDPWQMETVAPDPIEVRAQIYLTLHVP